MFKYINDENGWYLIIGLYCISMFIIPHSKLAVPQFRFGHFSCNRTWSPGYHGRHIECWFGRTYYGFDIDHYEDYESLQSYFKDPF